MALLGDLTYIGSLEAPRYISDYSSQEVILSLLENDSRVLLNSQLLLAKPALWDAASRAITKEENWTEYTLLKFPFPNTCLCPAMASREPLSSTSKGSCLLTLSLLFLLWNCFLF